MKTMMEPQHTLASMACVKTGNQACVMHPSCPSCENQNRPAFRTPWALQTDVSKSNFRRSRRTHNKHNMRSHQPRRAGCPRIAGQVSVLPSMQKSTLPCVSNTLGPSKRACIRCIHSDVLGPICTEHMEGGSNKQVDARCPVGLCLKHILCREEINWPSGCIFQHPWQETQYSQRCCESKPVWQTSGFEHSGCGRNPNVFNRLRKHASCTSSCLMSPPEFVLTKYDEVDVGKQHSGACGPHPALFWTGRLLEENRALAQAWACQAHRGRNCRCFWIVVPCLA